MWIVLKTNFKYHRKKCEKPETGTKYEGIAENLLKPKIVKIFLNFYAT